MDLQSYSTPEAFLSAYHQSKGEVPPSPAAAHWLRSLVERRYNVDSESYEYAESLLDRALIDVEDVAENFLGLDLQLNDLSEYDAGAQAPVYGFTYPQAGVINVCFRAEAYRPLYRTTVMHEVAHVVLHSGSYVALKYSPQSRKRPRIEREADAFMAGTLLPKPILYVAIVVASRDRGVEPGEAFRAANSAKGRWIWRSILFPFFVNRLCLSREFVGIQMVGHGFFSQETFDYHKTYALPNRWRRPSAPNMSRALHQVMLRARDKVQRAK